MRQNLLLKLNDTAQIRERRGFGSILAKAIPGLITLAIESVSSYIKGKQQQRINTAVEEWRNDDNKIRNDLNNIEMNFSCVADIT